jgi:hypothetical protein
MRIAFPTISISGVALTAMSGVALSQAVAPPPPSARTAMQMAVYDPQQFPARAVSITDETTHRTVTDSDGSMPMNPPRRPGLPRPPAALGASSETSGRVRMALHGAQGEVNGVLLESGTILRFPPGQAAQLASAIQSRQAVVAEGVTVTNSLGTVVDVQQFGPSRARMVAVGPPLPPPDDRGPAGPRHRPPPPPGAPLAPPPPPPVGLAPAPGASPPPPPPEG